MSTHTPRTTHSDAARASRQTSYGKFRKGLRAALAALVLLVLPAPAQAQMARLYAGRHGMQTSDCRRVSVDSRGFVWVLGAGDLGTFDGMRFRYVSPTGPDGRQLFTYANDVEEVAGDHYMVCTSSGLFLLDARGGKFRHIKLDPTEDSVYGYHSNGVTDYPQEDCKLVTTDGFGVFVINTRSWEVDTTASQRIFKELEDSFVEKPTIDHYNRMWAVNGNAQLVCVDMTSTRRRALRYTPVAEDIMRHSRVTALMETQSGMLIGTDHGVFVYDSSQDLISAPDPTTGGLYVTTILTTRDGRVLVGTDGNGIWEYHAGMNGAGIAIPANIQTADFDISYGKVMDMTEDKEGNIVAMFLQKGLLIIPPPSNCFHYHPISPDNNTKNATCITSLAIDGDENYWVGTDGCGVFTTQGMRLATAHPVCDGLNSLLVQDVKVDKRGTAWAGSYGGGVQYFANGRWHTDWLEPIAHDRVMVLHYDETADQLLVGTNGNGLWEIDIERHTLRRILIPTNQWIHSVTRDTGNDLWVGTSMGTFRYNPTTNDLTEILSEQGRIDNAACIVEDDSCVLIGWEKGLVICNKNTGAQTEITGTDDTYSHNTRAIATTEGYIWLATRTHIISIDKKTHEERNFSSFSGFEVGEFHGNSVVKPGHGYILFGGNNGIICFTPQLIISRNTEVKNVFFTGFHTSDSSEKMDASIQYATRVELPYDNSTFTITFSSVELGDPERVQYEFILEGHEQIWRKSVTGAYARYSNIPPGRYTFRVRAYMEDSPDRYEDSCIDIVVAYPWYATWWAYLIYAALAVTLGFAVWRQWRMRRKARELLRSQAEANRMKEAKLKLFTSITHELRSPLSMIESPLRQLMAEDENPDHQSLYSVMQRNCSRLLDIVKQITDIRKIDSGQLTLKMVAGDYVTYSDDVYDQFQGVATVKGIDFTIDNRRDTLPMMMDLTHFEKILTNILSNAFKFTPEGGKVRITADAVDNQVEIRFYNNGPALSREDLDHIWERFYQGSASSEATCSGIGLNLVSELVRMHHGTIDAYNVSEGRRLPKNPAPDTPAPDGVEFVLRFPCIKVIHTDEDTDNGSAPTVLIVDDDTELVAYTTSQLEKDYRILTAFSGNSAWVSVQKNRPDVVVTDYRMPDGSGMELCQHIRANRETDSIPIIMLTGEGDETLQLQSLNVQVDHYLEKPVNILMLKSAISQVLKVRENLRIKSRRAELNKDIPKASIDDPDEKLFARIDEALVAHLDNPSFGVTQLSELVGISRVHLNRKMKEHYGAAPSTFIKTFRLKQAASMLASRKSNISEVAYKVGFSSHPHFTTSFREYFGMSPKEFVAFAADAANNDTLEKMLM